VSQSAEPGRGPTSAELTAVGEAAGERLRAEAMEDPDSAVQASEALVAAATSAMVSGYSLRQIAEAEASGQDRTRRSLREDMLKRVSRTGRQARAAEAEHHRTIVSATRLGLSTREIAASAGVTHGTIRAIINRQAIDATPDPEAVDEPTGPTAAEEDYQG